jgi:hypothetical protein
MHCTTHALRGPGMMDTTGAQNRTPTLGGRVTLTLLKRRLINVFFFSVLRALMAPGPWPSIGEFHSQRNQERNPNAQYILHMSQNSLVLNKSANRLL